MTTGSEFPALGTTARVVVTEAERLGAAQSTVAAELRRIDAACSRFRDDSAITTLHADRGRLARIDPLLAEALEVALRAARLTGGLVDPTVGTSVSALGYDRDFAELRGCGGDAVPAAGWRRVLLDAARGEVVLPAGVCLDLGATAKAFAADRAARLAAVRAGCGVLVSLGGDIGLAGRAPEGGWQLGVGDDHASALDSPDEIVSLRRGGLACSGITNRTWRTGAQLRHHIVDPRTGENPPLVWRTVTVAAASCVDANTASTAAVVLGEDAPAWLAARRLPARLVHADGTVTRTPGWPARHPARPVVRAA